MVYVHLRKSLQKWKHQSQATFCYKSSNQTNFSEAFFSSTPVQAVTTVSRTFNWRSLKLLKTGSIQDYSFDRLAC